MSKFSKYNFISKWNRSSELFRTEMFILNFAQEKDLAKIENLIKQRRKELSEKNTKE